MVASYINDKTGTEHDEQYVMMKLICNPPWQCCLRPNCRPRHRRFVREPCKLFNQCSLWFLFTRYILSYFKDQQKLYNIYNPIESIYGIYPYIYTPLYTFTIEVNQHGNRVPESWILWEYLQPTDPTCAKVVGGRPTSLPALRFGGLGSERLEMTGRY